MTRKFVRDTRHISLARALHARLYMSCEGRIFVAGGEIAHAKLAQMLEQHDRCPTAAEAPTPTDLGLATCDGELTPALLHSMGRALNRWRKELQAELLRRPARRRSSKILVQEETEIERLESRLTAVRHWQRELSAGDEPAGAPYFLENADEAKLRTALESAQRGEPFPPLIAWQARLVYWLAGDCAMRRFLSAVSGLFLAYPAVSRRESVHRFDRALAVWSKRSECERVHQLRAELTQHIRNLDPAIVREGAFSSHLRGRTFQEHCRHLRNRCMEVLAKAELHRWHLVPAALAALAAADKSTAMLPRQCFRPAAEKENFAQLLRTIRRIAQQMGQKGYDALLGAFDQLPESAHECDYEELRELLAAGCSLADAIWACEQDVADSLKGCCLSVAAARQLSERFAKCGWPLNAVELSSLFCRIRQRKHLPPIHAWLNWIGGVSTRALTPKMRKAIRPVLWERYLPGIVQMGWFQQLAPCVASPHHCSAADDFKPLLDRISATQQLAGKESKLPKSLRDLLEVQDRRQREYNFLKSRRSAGTLDEASQARLLHLESAGDLRPNDAKIHRAAEELFLLFGLEAIVATTNRLAELRCREHFGEWVKHLTSDQYWDFARWTHSMSAVERDRLRIVIEARAKYGVLYKRHLRDNDEWISEAIVRGINLDAWLTPPAQRVSIDNRQFKITLANGLHHIFLMGAYFRTCLSPGGCNEMAVLSNAYDANKQVLFLFAEDEKGQQEVVARQLIGISSEFKLVGYCCYMNWRHVDKLRHQEVLNAMASYCGRLAAKCGLELANRGTPELIGDHFWYDDGECEWPEAAHASWEQTSQSLELLPTFV